MDPSTHRDTRPSSVDPVNVLDAAHGSQRVDSHRKKYNRLVVTLTCFNPGPIKNRDRANQNRS